jgi:hypothetical protein
VDRSRVLFPVCLGPKRKKFLFGGNDIALFIIPLPFYIVIWNHAT